METKRSLPHSKEPPLFNILNHKDAVHILTIKSIRFALILFYKFCPISH